MKIGHRTEILKADVSSVSPSSERMTIIEGLFRKGFRESTKERAFFLSFFLSFERALSL